MKAFSTCTYFVGRKPVFGLFRHFRRHGIFTHRGSEGQGASCGAGERRLTSDSFSFRDAVFTRVKFLSGVFCVGATTKHAKNTPMYGFWLQSRMKRLFFGKYVRLVRCNSQCSLPVWIHWEWSAQRFPLLCSQRLAAIVLVSGRQAHVCGNNVGIKSFLNESSCDLRWFILPMRKFALAARCDLGSSYKLPISCVHAQSKQSRDLGSKLLRRIR